MLVLHAVCVCVCVCQVYVARTLVGAKRYTEAERMLDAMYETAMRALGPKHSVTREALKAYAQLLSIHLQRQKEGRQLLKRAEALGCDVSGMTALV